MSPRWLRIRPTRRDDAMAGIVAGAVAAGAGLVTFYFARLLLARAPLEDPDPEPEPRPEARAEGR